jgi:rubrerythrin
MEALRRESELGKFYDEILRRCDKPDVRAFIAELAEKRRERINQTVAQINRLYSSFDPAGV